MSKSGLFVILQLLLAFSFTTSASTREKLVVLDLEAKYGVERGFAEALSVLVRDEIHSFGKYEVMSRADLQAVTSRESLLQAMGCDENETCLMDFGRALGTRFMVTGSLSKIGSRYNVSLKLLDTKGDNAGVVERASEGCKCSEDEFVEAVNRVAAELMGRKISVVKKQKEAEKKRQEAVAVERKKNKVEREKLAAEIKRLKEENKKAAAEKIRLTAERKKRKASVANINEDSFTDSTTGMEFVLVKGGSFKMGSPSSEKDRDDDEGPVHKVYINDIYMGMYEVTVSQWRKFIDSSGYQTDSERDIKEDGCRSLKNGKWGWQDGRYWDNVGFSQSGNQPVACVSHNDVVKFINWLNRESGKQYRLPMEAEWEYAVRAGTITARFWGNGENSACTYGNVADKGHNWSNHFSCSDGYKYSSPVGSFKPNYFGLYDMMGNVWEWTADLYSGDYYANSPLNNPQGDSSGSYWVVRGGGWHGRPAFVRSANRFRYDPWRRHSNLGFRLAFSPRVVQ